MTNEDYGKDDASSVAVDNPLGDNADGVVHVQKGMRALGIDGRYNLEKIDLRGIKEAPWVSPTCAACFYKPGPDPDGNQPAILVVLPQMVICSVFFTYICFTLPVGDACDSSLRKYGEWPTDHML
eukprot:COSAG02_NODE_34779_length_478_cov_0.947230_1_plen_124_part_01